MRVCERVEMGGIEPPSKEKTLKTSTYVASSSLSPFAAGRARQAKDISEYLDKVEVHWSPLRTTASYPIESRRPIRARWAERRMDGMPFFN
jgi:hypothetical protein